MSYLGKCNNKGEINLSLYLIHVPLSAIEAVAMHELTHYIHMDHKKGFYDTLTTFMPDYHSRMALYKSFMKGA